MSHDVFISYARDEIGRGELVRQRLEALGLTVFFDIEGGIDSGQSFPQRITDAVRSCKVVVGCWSPLAVTRDWVRRECLMARDLRKLVAVAVFSLPKTDLPAEFYDVSYLDLSRFEGSETHWEWNKCLESIANRLEEWAIANAREREAHDSTFDKAKRLKHWALEKSASPGRTLYDAEAIARAPEIWKRLSSGWRGGDTSELHTFADVAGGTKEAHFARQLARKIDLEWIELARLQVSMLHGLDRVLFPRDLLRFTRIDYLGHIRRRKEEVEGQWLAFSTSCPNVIETPEAQEFKLWNERFLHRAEVEFRDGAATEFFGTIILIVGAISLAVIIGLVIVLIRGNA